MKKTIVAGIMALTLAGCGGVYGYEGLPINENGWDDSDTDWKKWHDAPPPDCLVINRKSTSPSGFTNKNSSLGVYCREER